MHSALAVQDERFRAMSADEKVRLAQALWREARAVLAAGVRATHPDWPEERLAARVAELVRDAGD